MTPNIVHFVHVGGRPFSFVHFLSVYTASVVNRPDRILFHYTELPNGSWWQRTQGFLTLNRVEAVDSILGNAVKHPAHQADVIRLAMLRQHGGIYLDLDVVCLRPFTPLLSHPCVMGIEPGTGLCNAVLIAEASSEFLRRWHDEYRTFDGTDPYKWNRHSVVVPWQLAKAHPQDICVVDKYAFFYPAYNDPVRSYLWGEVPDWRALTIRMMKNAVRLTGQSHDEIRLAEYQTFHGLRSREWHYERAKQSFCLHLWESQWRERYLSRLSPDYLQTATSHFARLVREALGKDGMKGLAALTVDV